MQGIRLTGSVGIGGQNNAADIKSVQTALNKLLPLIPPTARLSVDGSLGRNPQLSKTVAAIKLFQQKVVGMIRPDGKIDANGRTHRKLNESLGKLVNAGASNAALTLSVRGLEILKQIEELRLTPYDDQTGKDTTQWCEGATVGYGHLIEAADWNKYKDGIDKPAAEALFKKDLAPFVSAVKKYIKVALKQNQFDALVIFTFNIGKSAFEKSSVVKMINDSSVQTQYRTLEDAWKAWKKSQGKVNQGLVNRRNSEWNIYSNNIYKGW